MLADINVKMSGSEKRKFLDVSRGSRAKQRLRNVQKKYAAREKFLFAN